MTAVKPGSFVHIELASTNPSRTRRFFEDVFGWEFTSMPGMEYHVYATPLGPGGAVMGPTEERPGGVLNYLLSGDIDGDEVRIEEAGGKVLLRKKEIPGVGWWSLFEDPTGLVLALFQSRSPDRGPVARFRSPARPRAKTARRAAKGRARRK